MSAAAIASQTQGNSAPSGVGGSLLDTALTGAFSLFAADQNRDFQRDMANTAHQREVKDLRQAGLNPILSAKHGGAATPSGAMAPTPNSDIGGKSIQSALAQKQMDLLTAQRIDTVSSADLKQAQSALIDSTATQTLEKMIAETSEILSRIPKNTAEYDRVKQSIRNMEQDLKNAVLSGKHSALGLDKASAESEYYKSVLGKSSPYVREILGAGSSALDAASKVRNIRRPDLTDEEFGSEEYIRDRDGRVIRQKSRETFRRRR